VEEQEEEGLEVLKISITNNTVITLEALALILIIKEVTSSISTLSSNNTSKYKS